MSKRMHRAAAALAVYLASLVVLIVVSLWTGPTFAEVERIAAVTRAEALIVNLVDHGPSVLVSSSAMAIYDEAKPFGIWPTLVSGWLSLAARQGGGFDLLTAQRSGFLVITAALPLAALWITRRRLGTGLSIVVAALCFAEPWLLHEAAVASDDAVVGASWLVVFGAYVRSLPGDDGRPSLGWTAATPVLLGVGMAVRLSALWVVPAILLHFVLLRRGELRQALGSGRVPLPASVLLSFVLTPALFVALCPALWRGGASKAIRLLLEPLGDGTPAGSATEGVYYLVAKVPLLLLVLAVVGTGLWVRSVVEAQRERDRTGLGLASAIFIIATILGPALTPPLLASFPTRIVAAMVFIAVLAAFALDRIVRRLVADRWRPVALGASVICIGAVLCIDISTAGAAYGAIVGGPTGVLGRETFPPSDGSELGQLRRLLPDGAARVHAKDVSKAYFDALAATGRADGVRWAKSPRGADFELVRGEAQGSSGEIEYQRDIVWSLVPTGS